MSPAHQGRLVSGMAILIVIGMLSIVGFLNIETGIQPMRETSTSQAIPLQSDDGSDPINVIFAGYAPSWWVAANMVNWSDSAYCSAPKTVDGREYNSTLEYPDLTGGPCVGPRDHIRIWDMGFSPEFGVWSVASTHHEHTVCDPFCHHVIDSWTRPQKDVRSSFLSGQFTVSISNYTMANSGTYQGVLYNGNATMIKLGPPSQYPVIFNENGLGNQTSWSVTLNGTTIASSRPDIVFQEKNGTYPFTVAASSKYDASPSSGRITVNGSLTRENVQFSPAPAVPYWEYAIGGALSVGILGTLIILFKMKWRRRSGPAPKIPANTGQRVP